MKVAYLVIDDTHGLVCICSTEERAKAEVKDISINEYGMKTDEEIWEDKYGNQLVYFTMREVIE